MNFNNFVHLKGNVVRKPVIQPNKDGSSTALFTIAVKGTMKDPKTGQYPTDFVSCRHYLKQGTRTYNYIEAGTPIELRAQLQTVAVGEAPNVSWITNVNVKEVVLCETKVAKKARLARKTADGNIQPEPELEYSPDYGEDEVTPDMFDDVESDNM